MNCIAFDGTHGLVAISFSHVSYFLSYPGNLEFQVQCPFFKFHVGADKEKFNDL